MESTQTESRRKGRGSRNLDCLSRRFKGRPLARHAASNQVCLICRSFCAVFDYVKVARRFPSAASASHKLREIELGMEDLAGGRMRICIIQEGAKFTKPHLVNSAHVLVMVSRNLLDGERERVGLSLTDWAWCQTVRENILASREWPSPLHLSLFSHCR